MPIISVSNLLIEDMGLEETRYKQYNHGMFNFVILSSRKHKIAKCYNSIYILTLTSLYKMMLQEIEINCSIMIKLEFHHASCNIKDIFIMRCLGGSFD